MTGDKDHVDMNTSSPPLPFPIDPQKPVRTDDEKKIRTMWYISEDARVVYVVDNQKEKEMKQKRNKPKDPYF